MERLTYPEARKIMEQAHRDASWLSEEGATHNQRVGAEKQMAAIGVTVNTADELAHMVAKLLQDAMRRQEIEPNAGTAARISEAKYLLTTINGEG